MPNGINVSLLFVYVLVFMMIPSLPAYPEDLLPFAFACAVIGATSLAFATTDSRRAMSLAATVVAIAVATVFWHSGKVRLQIRVVQWREQAVHWRAVSESQATSAATQP